MGERFWLLYQRVSGSAASLSNRLPTYLLVLVETIGCCLSHFPYCCAKMPQQKQLKGKGVYFGSQFKDIVHHVRESWWQEHEAASQVACAVSKQREMSTGVSFLGIAHI